ncbi:hypothetical protein Srufu_009280 [Streptomyces libani subsp. rufus]|nr:hypothetical protein Srufu_009280 [Streptomyces libani subsp. rufus]
MNMPGDEGRMYLDEGASAAVERTFEALPAAPGQAFARSWWGQAWLKALEDTALDGAQVKLGRRHARAGAVGAVSVRPGRITAVVQDRDHTRHRSDVLLQQLSAADWDRFLDLVADRAGHIAALLDRDMPPVLVEDAAAAGIELLPGIGDLESECSCGAWDHCAHSTALCYQLARLLDQDPFVLLLMRGRGEQELLEELQARSASRAEGPAGAGVAEPSGAGVPAVEAYAARDILPPLPAPPAPVATPGIPPVLGGGTPPAPGVDVAALEFLIGDAAARAQLMLADALSPRHPDGPPPPVLTPAQDAVRLAASLPGGPYRRGWRPVRGVMRGLWRQPYGPGSWAARRGWRSWRRTGHRSPRRWRGPPAGWRPRGRTRRPGRGCGSPVTAGRWWAGRPSCATGGTAAGGRTAGRAGSGYPRVRPRTIRRARWRGCRRRGEEAVRKNGVRWVGRRPGAGARAGRRRGGR